MLRSYRLLSAVLLTGGVTMAQEFVTAEGPTLMLAGKEYRAIGVNIPHLASGFMGTWFHWEEIYGTREAMKEAITEAVRDARKHHIAFIRFFASPGYPKGTAEIYLADPAEYWRRMDEVFTLCRNNNIRLVPSLGMLKWHNDCRERATAVLDPNSKTYAATRRYISEFVTRYRDDPTVLMWELENEAFLHADVNMDGRPALPVGVYPPGTTGVAKTSTREDSLRWDMLVTLNRDMAAYIRQLDPNHLITSGDAGPREESVCRRLTFPDFKWRIDTVREYLADLLESQPEPLDVFSIHVYGNTTGKNEVGGLGHDDFLRIRIHAVRAARAPLFIGELGQTDPHFQQDNQALWTRSAIDLLDAEGVSLIALWVWHFPWQDKDFNIPNGAAQPQLMERVRQFNDTYADTEAGNE